MGEINLAGLVMLNSHIHVLNLLIGEIQSEFIEGGGEFIDVDSP